LYLPKPTNPLVECEDIIKKPQTCKTPYTKETKIFIDDNKYIHGQQKLLPIHIQYYDKNTICKITVEFVN
jgi:hypothetical protein